MALERKDVKYTLDKGFMHLPEMAFITMSSMSEIKSESE